MNQGSAYGQVLPEPCIVIRAQPEADLLTIVDIVPQHTHSRHTNLALCSAAVHKESTLLNHELLLLFSPDLPNSELQPNSVIAANISLQFWH
jgi:hypothetical protein